MASSGTITLTVDFKYKPTRGREEALIAGKGKIKSTAVIEAQALDLRTIRNFVAQPFYPLPHAAGTYREGPAMLYGSLSQSGSMANSVTLRTLKGSCRVPSGTVHMGTRAAGSIQFGFLAVGA